MAFSTPSSELKVSTNRPFRGRGLEKEGSTSVRSVDQACAWRSLARICSQFCKNSTPGCAKSRKTICRIGRTVTSAIWSWWQDRRTKRSLLLTGARQVRKTTVLRQIIRRLINAEVVPDNDILYATFDHPLSKLAWLERTVQSFTVRIWYRDSQGKR